MSLQQTIGNMSMVRVKYSLEIMETFKEMYSKEIFIIKTSISICFYPWSLIDFFLVLSLDWSIEEDYFLISRLLTQMADYPEILCFSVCSYLKRES